MLPLSSACGHARQKPLKNKGNVGLYYNKFFNGWPKGGSKVEESAKLDWIKEFCGSVGDPGRIELYVQRLNKLVDGIGGHTEDMVLVSPFVTGMGLNHPVENGFLWHHSLGIPYLPGSSIKGMVRAWAEHWEGLDKTVVRRLFGGSKEAPAAGNLIIFDALPVKPVELIAEVMTPHDAGWRLKTDNNSVTPSDWVSPVPIPFLAVKPDAVFQFSVATRKDAESEDLVKAFEYIKRALEHMGAGAKTATGMGRFLSRQALALVMASANKWEPLVGERVMWKTGDEQVIIKSINGSRVAFYFPDDEDESDEADIGEFQKI